ncbi:MAG: FKBP-type peptidyl-prolyl cis-trans isomerase [Bacteroidia bacterium]|nr:FKBP-type peptidyl-prolyl cis-trans isomerase [Bacteroidia bacterium]
MSFLQDFLQKRNLPHAVTEEGLYYHVARPGQGPQAQAGDYVRVHYTGSFLNGKVFDSSLEGGEPIVFRLGQGQVIPGWDKGIALFNQGAKGHLYIPPEMAYGAQGAGDVIPPNSSLQFEIELVEILDEAGYQAWEATENERRRKMIEEYIEVQMKKELTVIATYAQQHDLPFQMTESGLFYLIEEAGEGKKAEPGATVTVHYTGRLLTGKIFDSSHNRNQPISFQLGAGRVIQGWEEGIALFREGGKGKLMIPSPLGYGPRDMGDIPSESTLLFDIELVKVE